MLYGHHEDDGLADSDAYDRVGNAPHQATAFYDATEAYNDHREKTGQPVRPDPAKTTTAGFAGYFNRMVERKGLDFLDKHMSKTQHFRQTAEYLYSTDSQPRRPIESTVPAGLRQAPR